MLRDIPDGTEQEEIKVLFGEFTDNITNMQPEVGNNYYVNFDTTEVTQKAFNLVRQQSFNGKSIGCCITSNFTFHNYAYPYVYIPPEYQENPYKNYNKDYNDQKKKNLTTENVRILEKLVVHTTIQKMEVHHTTILLVGEEEEIEREVKNLVMIT